MSDFLMHFPSTHQRALYVKKQTPEQRIKELEQQLAETQKTEFFEAVVYVLKKDFGVRVTKKRPGKSFKPER